MGLEQSHSDDWRRDGARRSDDRTGTNVERAFLGEGGYVPDLAPFRPFIDEQVRDLADNRGSRCRRPRCDFFGAQSTPRATNPEGARRHREKIIREILSRRHEIAQVLRYEATDWLHTFPFDDPKSCSHAFAEQYNVGGELPKVAHGACGSFRGGRNPSGRTTALQRKSLARA
jgi:hypothetical protein